MAVRKTYLIAGAGGDIGSALVARLESQQKEAAIDLVLLDRSVDALNSVKSTALPHRVIVHDFKDDPSTLSSKFAELGPLHAAIYAVGVQQQHRLQDEVAWREVFEINFFGAVQFANAVRTALTKQSVDYGHLVLLSSAASRIGATTAASYSASKAALNNLVMSLALSFAKQRILVNAVAPGWVDSSLQRAAFSEMAALKQVPLADLEKALLRISALGRLSTPEEIAAVIAFLASGTQTSITGQTIDVNNGLFLT